MTNFIDLRLDQKKPLKMRIVYLILITFLITSCFSSKRAITGNLSSNDFVIQYINKIAATGAITKSPLLVIDGNVIKYSEYRKDHKPLRQLDINELNYFPKDNQNAYNIFGKSAKGGVILVTTNSFIEPKTLILLDGKKISMEEFVRLNPSDFESFEVIENKENIKKYTTEDFDNIMIVKMKKKDK